MIRPRYQAHGCLVLGVLIGKDSQGTLMARHPPCTAQLQPRPPASLQTHILFPGIGVGRWPPAAEALPDSEAQVTSSPARLHLRPARGSHLLLPEVTALLHRLHV